MKKFNLTVSSSFCLLLLSGCFDDTSDIQAHMEQVKATTTSYIEPMPEVKPFYHIDYSASDLRSPFVLPQAEVIQQKMQQMSGCLSPDIRRRKQPLEKYALSDLTMRGTLGDSEALWALVEASDDTLHRISVGNYIGLYNGRIIDVTAKGITMIELTPDGAGCWVEQEAKLTLVNSESNK